MAKKIIVTMMLDELLEIGEFEEGMTLDEILQKIGMDKVSVVEVEEEPIAEDGANST